MEVTITSQKQLNLLATLPADEKAKIKSINGINCNLTYLPAEFFAGFTNLWRFDFSSNKIEGLPSNIFECFPSLKKFYINKTKNFAKKGEVLCKKV